MKWLIKLAPASKVRVVIEFDNFGKEFKGDAKCKFAAEGQIRGQLVTEDGEHMNAAGNRIMA
jgi:hypothetical protein